MTRAIAQWTLFPRDSVAHSHSVAVVRQPVLYRVRMVTHCIGVCHSRCHFRVCRHINEDRCCTLVLTMLRVEARGHFQVLQKWHLSVADNWCQLVDSYNIKNLVVKCIIMQTCTQQQSPVTTWQHCCCGGKQLDHPWLHFGLHWYGNDDHTVTMLWPQCCYWNRMDAML